MATYQPKFSGEYIGVEKALSNHELCQILSDVVQCPSVCGSETQCGHLLAQLGKEHGFAVELMETSQEGRFNVMITYGAENYLEKPYGLLFHGHYDTVPVLDMEDPYNTEVTENQTMCGRGIVDQKSGLVAALSAMIAIKRSGIPLKKPVGVVCVVDEESEHRGSYALGKTGLKADYAIVTEPSSGNCEMGCRGTTPIRITVKGVTAHASNPGAGVNAIQHALPILEDLFAMKFPKVDLGELGVYEGSLCVSKLDAGTAYNNVPGEAVIWMDRRTVPGETSQLAIAQVQAVLDKAKEKNPKLQAIAEIARPDWHWPPIAERGLNPTSADVHSPLYDILNQGAEKVGWAPIPKTFCFGYNDMDFLSNDLGIPTLVYGCGNGYMAHTQHEEVSLDDCCRFAEIFAQTIKTLCT